jgi:hypothetical protein
MPWQTHDLGKAKSTTNRGSSITECLLIIAFSEKTSSQIVLTIGLQHGFFQAFPLGALWIPTAYDHFPY